MPRQKKEIAKYERIILEAMLNSPQIGLKGIKQELVNGWVDQKFLKKATSGTTIPESKINFICTELEKKGYVEKNEKDTVKTQRGRTSTKIWRVKRDKQTLIKLWIFFVPGYFMSTEYYLKRPQATQILQEYAKETEITKNEHSIWYKHNNEEINYYLQNNPDITTDSKKEDCFDPTEKLILASPKLFYLFLSNREEFRNKYKRICTPFKSKNEAAKYISTIGAFMDFTNYTIDNPVSRNNVNEEEAKARKGIQIRENIFSEQYYNERTHLETKGYQTALFELLETDEELTTKLLQKKSKKK